MSGRAGGKEGGKGKGATAKAGRKLDKDGEVKKGTMRETNSRTAKVQNPTAPKEVERYKKPSMAPTKNAATSKAKGGENKPEVRENAAEAEHVEEQQAIVESVPADSEVACTKTRRMGRDLLMEETEVSPTRITINRIEQRCIGEERIAAMRPDELAEAVCGSWWRLGLVMWMGAGAEADSHQIRSRKHRPDREPGGGRADLEEISLS